MAKQKADPAAATHFLTSHAVGAFGRGQVVTAEQVLKSFGKDVTSSPEEHEAYRKDSLKRLLDLGAIVPTEAPEEPEEAPAPEPEKPPAPEPEPAKPAPHPHEKRPEAPQPPTPSKK